jgi:hypothetical protein
MRQLGHGLCMCAIERLNGQDKLFISAFDQGMVVGARRTGLSVSRTATLLGFSYSTISCVYKEWSTTQRIFSQPGPASLWNAFDTLYKVHALTNQGYSEGKMC